MRRKMHSRIANRICAAVLSMMMVLSLIPVSTLTVSAATDAHPNAVTISVVNQNGEPLAGAAVNYTVVSSADSSKVKEETGELTDGKGVLEVMSADEYANYTTGLSISAEVSQQGYATDNTTIKDDPIQSGEQDFQVQLRSTQIGDVTVTPIEKKYTGEAFDAVIVNGLKEDDKVTYQVNGEPETEDMPKIADVGDYTITVQVKRDGYDTFSETVTSHILKGEIVLDIKALDRDYTGTADDAVTILSGLESGDVVTYEMNGSESLDCPQISEAGEYDVTVKVQRNNYDDFLQRYTARIRAVKIEGLSATLSSWTYDGKYHPMVEKIDGLQAGDIVNYRLDENAPWSRDIPEEKDAGEYTVFIQVSRKNYLDTTDIALNPAKVIVKKAEQSIAFKESHTEDSVVFDSSTPLNNEYDFSAAGGSLTDPKITYTVSNDSEGDITSVDEIAVIDNMSNPGKLTILSGGHNIRITATVEGNNNYEEASVEYRLTVVDADTDLISFASQKISYILGRSDTISDQAAEKKYLQDNGTITYAAEMEEGKETLESAGISIGGQDGKVTVTDYVKLSAALSRNNDSLRVKVTAKKTEGTKKRLEEGGSQVVYGECEKSYIIEINYETAPEKTYILKAPDGSRLSAPNGDNGWFCTAVNVEPAMTGAYLIAKDKPEDFVSSVEFNDQGEAERTIFLRDTSTQGIVAPIVIDVQKIDSVKPNALSVEYSEPVLSKIFSFYDAPVTVTFTAYDKTSGVDRFEWNYTRSEGASTTNLDKDSGAVAAVADSKEPTKFTAQIKLPKSQVQQMRGYLTVNAVDKAGLVSEEVKDDGRMFVVDTISPTQSVTFELEKAGGTSQVVDNRYYFSDHVKFTFHITETNFFSEDVVVKVAKDGKEGEVISVDWDVSANQDEYIAEYVLSEDGDYTVSMEYADRSGHKMENYESPLITVDTVAPEITFSYSNGTNTSASADNEQSATVTITEHNFRAGDIEVMVDAKDINGNKVTEKGIQEYLRTAEWKQEGDVYTAVISDEFVDAFYQLTFDYKDLALNPAKQVSSGEFIVDHLAPEEKSLEVTYSLPVTERIISAVTFGYYNPSVDVTFKANDLTSGVDYFIWTYVREDGASNLNTAEYADAKISAVQDSADKSKFTASITLPKDAADQLRGNIAFTATDRYANTSAKLTDTAHTIIVDTIAPTMTAEYNTPSRAVGAKMYYNKDLTATFTVTEANFYSEDVIVEVSKDGGEFERVMPSWTDISTDIHAGTYKIAAPADHMADGDYVFRVQYTDRSNNQMSVYTSDTIVLDTIEPVIKVAYSNNKVVNALTDTEGHTRTYLDSTQVATIDINEHNFNEDEVDFKIIARDVSGNDINVDAVSRKSSWINNGDNHTMTITYPGDANYTFDIDYTDLATNASVDYAEDYFTVDTSAPDNLTVSYSSSILDTVLQAITFGFYNAGMTVTITADDDTSSVHGFQYDCSLASGVSSVNAELVNQAMEEASITYSNNRRTATAEFELPRGALGGNNQFNGNVSFRSTDRSGNESSQFDDDKRIVVDNITPTAEVTYSAPVQAAGGISYYDASVTATVTINEANFYSEDVQVSVTKDGASYPVSPSWSDNSADVHVGTFSLNDDGDYFITINYMDKSSNRMAEYTSEQLTVDTEINEPVITINGGEANGKAFKDEVVPEVNFEDTNFENYEIKLTRTRYGDKDVDVTEKFIGGNVSVTDKGGAGSFDTFSKAQDTDGIYNLTVSMSDKAGHTAETSAMFTVNRYGSVYEYNDYLSTLIKDGGAYVQEVENDLVITEYNADRLVRGSLDLEVLRDGKPLLDVDYEIAPQMNDQVSVGSSGWYQYQYTVSKDNFDSDGVYKLSVASKDATGNSPETTNYKDKNILFRVDSTAPEINSITGLEESIINAQDVTSKYTVYDTIGLESVKVYVDGDNIDTITDFSEDANNYTGSFTISEKNKEQKVRLVVRDLAGNETDTDSDNFESAFAFNSLVTVSTNFFVRFVANKPIFWGSIIGTIGIITAAGILIGKRRKKVIIAE